MDSVHWTRVGIDDRRWHEQIVRYCSAALVLWPAYLVYISLSLTALGLGDSLANIKRKALKGGCQPGDLVECRGVYTRLCHLSHEVSQGFPAYVIFIHLSWLLMKSGSGIAFLVASLRGTGVWTTMNTADLVTLVGNLTMLVGSLIPFANAANQVTLVH